MTKQADLKRRVRARMAKTGESYASARTHVLAARPEPAAATDALHVTNGDATVPGLRGTGLADTMLPWRDVLHEGPVPEVPDDELRRIRTAFLASEDADDIGTATEFAERDRTLEAHRDGEYVLWFEADLYDQLQLIQILARLTQLEVPSSRITLICVGEHVGVAHFGGLGELTSEQLSGLHTAAATTLTSEALEHEGAPTAGDAFVRAAAREARPFLGDTWCFDRMSRFAGAHTPLLEAEPAGTAIDRHTRVRLTDAGRRVLDGDEDHVALNGIDRWIGGVHLTGRQIRWRWDEGTESIRDAVT